MVGDRIGLSSAQILYNDEYLLALNKPPGSYSERVLEAARGLLLSLSNGTSSGSDVNKQEAYGANGGLQNIPEAEVVTPHLRHTGERGLACIAHGTDPCVHHADDVAHLEFHNTCSVRPPGGRCDEKQAGKSPTCEATSALDSLYLVHRLDRDTSGVLLLAKSQAMAGAMGKLMERRAVRKTYVALCVPLSSQQQGQSHLEKCGNCNHRDSSVSTGKLGDVACDLHGCSRQVVGSGPPNGIKSGESLRSSLQPGGSTDHGRPASLPRPPSVRAHDDADDATGGGNMDQPVCRTASAYVHEDPLLPSSHPHPQRVTLHTGHGRSRHGLWRVYALEDVGRKLPGGSRVRDMRTVVEVVGPHACIESGMVATEAHNHQEDCGRLIGRRETATCAPVSGESRGIGQQVSDRASTWQMQAHDVSAHDISAHDVSAHDISAHDVSAHDLGHFTAAGGEPMMHTTRRDSSQGGAVCEGEGCTCQSGREVQSQKRDEHQEDYSNFSDEGSRRTWERGLRVLAYPEGGRTHQIRLHCQHMGIPLVGDVRYGGPEVWNGKQWPWHTLHAMEVGFTHPVTGNVVTIRAPLPPWC